MIRDSFSFCFLLFRFPPKMYMIIKFLFTKILRRQILAPYFCLMLVQINPTFEFKLAEPWKPYKILHVIPNHLPIYICMTLPVYDMTQDGICIIPCSTTLFPSLIYIPSPPFKFAYCKQSNLGSPVGEDL